MSATDASLPLLLTDRGDLDTLALYRLLVDLAAEAVAVDTVIGRPDALVQRLCALRDVVGALQHPAALAQQAPAVAGRVELTEADVAALSVSPRVADALAAQQAPAAEPVAPDCPRCNGSGTVRLTTTGRGPDDYDFDADCPACFGTGSGDLRDAIKALPYSLHRVRPCVEVVSRAEVLQILEARAQSEERAK